MISFQEAIVRLLRPTVSRPDLAEKPALVQAAAPPELPADRALSYRDLEQSIARARAAFAAAGVVQDDAVVLCAHNSPELVAAILATWTLGAVALPVDHRLTRVEIENITEKVRAKALFSPDPPTDRVRTIRAGDWPETAPEIGDDIIDRMRAEQPALVILTSGTTGMPKGALHSLGTLIDNVSELGASFGMSEKDNVFLPLPVSHIFGIAMVLTCLEFRGTVVLSDFVPQEFWPAAARLRTTMMVGVPTIYGALVNMPSPPAEKISIEHYLSGGAPLPVSLAEEFERKYAKRITEGYGTTEAKILCFNKDGPYGSVGKPLPSVQIEIVDQNGEAVGEGKTGEIRISGPTLMNGYLGRPEDTEKVLRNGHYYTGDMGYIKDERLYISGRSKEMIIVAGFKVFPAEVESVLRQHQLAREVAVVGVPHKRLGQLVKAVVVIKEGDACNMICSDDEQTRKEGVKQLTADFRAYCQKTLKRELRPMEWEFRPASCPLPKTLTGKIDKKQLATVS